MFKKIQSPDDVIAMKLSGTLTGDDIKQYKALFDEKLAKHNAVGIYVDMVGFSDMHADAIIEDFKVEFELMSHLKQFKKMAFVSDKEWLKAIVKIVTPMLPSLNMKVFVPADSEAAMKWASDIPVAKA